MTHPILRQTNAQVYKAQLLGVTVAVKQATARKKTSGEALLREIRYLRLAGAHPNIVTPFGAFDEGGRLHLVLEYARHCLRNDRVARQVRPPYHRAPASNHLRKHGTSPAQTRPPCDRMCVKF